MKGKGGRPTKLTCKDVLTIVKYCKEQKVLKLVFGDLVIQYQASGNDENQTPLEAGQQPINNEKEIEDVLQKEELNIKEEELALMAVENPEEFEEVLARGDITEIVNGDENNSIRT